MPSRMCSFQLKWLTDVSPAPHFPFLLKWTGLLGFCPDYKNIFCPLSAAESRWDRQTPRGIHFQGSHLTPLIPHTPHTQHFLLHWSLEGQEWCFICSRLKKHPFHLTYYLGYQLFSATLGILFYALPPMWEGQNCVDYIRSDNSLYFRDLAEKKQCPHPLSLLCFKAFPYHQTPGLVVGWFSRAGVTQVWEGLGHHDASCRHFGSFSRRSFSVPLRGLSLPWRQLRMPVCDSNTRPGDVSDSAPWL